MGIRFVGVGFVTGHHGLLTAAAFLIAGEAPETSASPARFYENTNIWLLPRSVGRKGRERKAPNSLRTASSNCSPRFSHMVTSDVTTRREWLAVGDDLLTDFQHEIRKLLLSHKLE